MVSSSKRISLSGVVAGLMLGLAISGSSGATGAERDGTVSADAGARGVHTVVLANQVLDRWQAVAEQLGVNSTVWREIFATQFSLMDNAVLRRIDAVQVDAADAKASYAQFAYAVRSAIMQSYQLGASGKGQMKLGSPTTDQVFIPIVPCRVVDTRNAGGGGPIPSFATRNWNYYTDTGGYSFSSQGGAPGTATAACPGTIFTNDAGQYGAAMLTVTVVSPTFAPGNLIAWGGAGATPPTTSVINWSTVGEAIANTTAVPAGGRTGSGPGGAVLDFAINNNSFGTVQVVVDVVGYFVENLATQLDCVDSATTEVIIIAGANGNQVPGACPTGYAPVAPICNTNTNEALAVVGWTSSFACFYHNFDTVPHHGVVSQRCCRIPGR